MLWAALLCAELGEYVLGERPMSSGASAAAADLTWIT